MTTWIRLQRNWRDNPLFDGEFSRGEAWLWLIEQAAWKPTRVRVKGDTVELARGELSFSQRFLAEKWGWSKSRVYRFMSDLRDEGMIETRAKIGATAGHNAGQGQSIINICNYAKYQDIGNDNRGNDDNKIGATAGQQRGNSGAKKEPLNHIPIDDDDARESVDKISDDLCRLAGIANISPAHIAKHMDLVRTWIAEGFDPQKDIVPVIRDTLNTNTERISSLKYFDAPVRQAKARKEAKPHATRTRPPSLADKLNAWAATD